MCQILARLGERETQIARIDATLGRKKEVVDVEQLRGAVSNRATEWKAELRAEPQAARLLLRRLVRPLVLFDPQDFSAFVEGSVGDAGVAGGFGTYTGSGVPEGN